MMIYREGAVAMYLLDILLKAAENVYYLLLGVSGGGCYPEKLSAAEEKSLFLKAAEGSEEARSRLIEHNLRLVAHVCKKYYQNPAVYDDMLSVGTIGLIKAVDSYKLDKGTRFSSYAARCIENASLSQRLEITAKRKIRRPFQASGGYTAKSARVYTLCIRANTAGLQ